jgi:hypothetical protein
MMADGPYCSFAVAMGFSQVAGKYFQEHHAPVVNDTNFHVVLILTIIILPV